MRTQTRSVFTTNNKSSQNITKNKNSIYSITTATILVVSSNNASNVVSARDYARWAKTVRNYLLAYIRSQYYANSYSNPLCYFVLSDLQFRILIMNSLYIIIGLQTNIPVIR